MSEHSTKPSRGWDVLAAIGLGGALGAALRWALALGLASDGFPIGTLIANLSGAAALGALMVVVNELLAPTRLLRPFLGVGVLGGYTTFSTAMLDLHTMLADGRYGVAIGYLAASVLGGLAAVLIGEAVARAIGALVQGERGRPR